MRTRLFTLVLSLFIGVSFAQQSDLKWSSSLNQDRSFVENKGQFDGFGASGSDVRFALDGGQSMVLFSNDGFTLRFVRKNKNTKRKRGQRSEARFLEEKEIIEVKWVGAGPDVKLRAEQMADDRNTYAMRDKDKATTHVEDVRGYRKLVYENLYPNIDVEFVVHEIEGVKYNVILHPGADPALFAMLYPEGYSPIMDEEGNLIIETDFGKIVDHTPATFYANSGATIASKFKLNGNRVGFELENYDPLQKVVIDPWVQTPPFGNSQGIWDIDVDDVGNVYVYGGDTPMRLRKYDPAGALLWTYNTPWDSANYWIGTMITEPVSGDCYITAGTDPVIARINTGGTQDWTANGGAFDEYWKLAFNCDHTRLMLGGTRLTLGPTLQPIGYGYVFEINMSNGAQINQAQVASLSPGPLGLIGNPNEVRAMCPSPNGKYYYMTLDTIGVFTENLTLGYQNNHGYGFSYQVAGYGATNQSINAMAATTDFLYTQNGSTLHKRNIVDGSIVGTVTIPSGITSVDLGFASAENGGLVLDSCGNVYVGSSNGVYKFDADLNQLGFQSTPGRVYDVAVNSAGEVVACGQGFVASLNLTPCAPPKAICLNCLELTPAGPFCQTDAAVTLVADPVGGTWSGPGITDPILGTFDPAVADTGTHIIHFTPTIPLVCGIDSLSIRVNYCVELQACLNGAGDITVSNGVGPYVWSHLVDTLDCSACFPGFPPVIQPCSTPPGCAVQSTIWLEFATDTTVTPTGNWPISIEDSQGNVLLINAISDLPACESGCFITVNLPSQTVACTGDSATAVAVVSGAIGTVDYSWNTTPEQTGPIATGLAPGNYYMVTVIDDSLCVAMDSVLVVEQECIGPVVCVNPFNDMVAEGNGPFTWFEMADSTDCSACIAFPGLPPCSFPPGCGITISAWQQFATGETVTPTGNWPVAVVDVVGDTLFINSLSELPACLFQCYVEVDVPDQSFVCFEQSDAEVMAVVSGAIGNVNYSWNTAPVQTSQTATGLGVGTYIVSVIDQNNCEDSDTVEVSMIPQIILTVSGTDSLCLGTNTGNAMVAASGGVGTFQYAWNTTPVQTTATANNLSVGTYDVTVTDLAGCQAVGTVTIESFAEVVANAGATDTICEGEQTELIATGGVSYEWNTGEETASITVGPESATRYDVMVTGTNGCTDMDTVWVLVETVPEVSLLQLDSSYCIIVPPFQVTGQPQGGTFLGPGVSPTGMFDPEAAGPGLHTLIYRFAEFQDCYGEATLEVFVDEDGCNVVTPNVFNPNSDFNGQVDFCGNVPQNNVFNLPCLEWYPGNRVRIFDRWGIKHYDQTDYHLKPWDGSNQSDGVFYYILEFTDREAIKGYFHLVR